ncbi:MAG: glycosyltransferase family 9 protein [Vulcanimicrobiaceae bacterium]
MNNDRALLYCAGGGIGDSLLASIVARALRERYTNVDALTLPAHRSTLERVPDIDRVFVDEGDERDVAARVASERYDACVVTWATARTARVPQHAGIPIRVGQARRLYSYRFTDRVVVRSEMGDVTSHWSDILLDYPRVIGCNTRDHRPRFVTTPHDEEQAQAVRLQHGLAPREYMVLHATNAIAPERGIWPVVGWIALARALERRFGTRIVLTGTAKDAPIVAAICAEADATDLSGATGIGGFAALVRDARAFVGITTGSMHIAAAAGAPTIGIFPFQSDVPERWAPLGERTAVVRASYPCHGGDTKERCSDYACIAHLDIPRILAAVASLIA